MPRIMSKSEEVRIKKHPSFVRDIFWGKERGWRVERLDSGKWKLIGFRDTLDSAKNLADQACVVLDTSYKVVK